MAEGKVVFFLASWFLDGELKFALDPPHEQVVDDDIVGGIVHFVLDAYKFELSPH